VAIVGEVEAAAFEGKNNNDQLDSYPCDAESEEALQQLSLADNCADTNNGAVDKYGDGCAEYNGYDWWCSHYDIIDVFDSCSMCCACSGSNRCPEGPPPTRQPTPTPTRGAQSAMTNALRQATLDNHNKMRRELVQSSNMIEMIWDSKLETVAQNFIESIPDDFKKSDFSHNKARTEEYQNLGGNGYVGENWFSGQPTEAAIYWTNFTWPKAWGFNDCSEQQNYWAAHESSSTNGLKYLSCEGGMTGHYTQVMWASSARVGCGWSQRVGTVCNYSPGGNIQGIIYAKFGLACSECPLAFNECNSGLCSDGTSTDFTDSLHEQSTTSEYQEQLVPMAVAKGLRKVAKKKKM